MESNSSSPVPYKGLVPFAEQDAQYFFGRENDCDDIRANLYAARLTILYGPSGVGKSSLLQAGVTARLHQKPGQAVVVFNTWSGDALQALKYAIATESTHLFPNARVLTYDSPLAEFTSSVIQDAHLPLLVLLDQFEEYFFYHPTDHGTHSFAAEFARAVNDATLSANFLISIREDSLAKLDRFEGRIPNLFDNYLRLEYLDESSARAAILNPLTVYNQQMPSDQQIAIEDNLVEQVIRQVTIEDDTQGGAQRALPPALQAATSGEPVQVEPAHLQLVMRRLWDEEKKRKSRTLRLATLNSLGGRKGVLQTYLDDTMNKLTPDQRKVSAYIFNYLVTPSGLKLALTSEELAGYAQVPTKRVDGVVRALSGSGVRVLRAITIPLTEPPLVRYELYHDALAPAVRGWRQRYLTHRTLLERITIPATLFAILALVATNVLPSFLPPLGLGIVRFVGITILHIAVLLQLYRWFYRDIELSIRALPLPGLGGPNLSIVLGSLLSLLWLFGTKWPTENDPIISLGTVDNVALVLFTFTVMLTLLTSLLVFLAMRAVGDITLRIVKNFDVGFYGTYTLACLLALILIIVVKVFNIYIFILGRTTG